MIFGSLVPIKPLELLPMRLLLRFVSLSLLLLPVHGVTADGLLTLKDWEKVNEDNGVTVYINDSGDSQIIRVKTEVLIQAPIKKIESILDDVSNRKDWIPFLTESRLIHTYTPLQRLEYSIFYGPWPTSDRDFVYRLTLNYRDEHKVIYSMISEENSLMPEQEDKVRAQLIESYYTLIARNDNKTRVELIFHADPKGYVPVWIVNIIQRVLPYLILKNLKERAESDVNP